MILFPLLVVMGFPVGVLTLSGELSPVSLVVLLNNGSSQFLYGPAYSNPVFSYKMEEVAAQRPEIMALGSSRVMQFRRESFREPRQFYNAGGAVGRLDQYTAFMLQVRKKPAIIVIGIDQYEFNENFVKNAIRYDDYALHLTSDRRAGLGTIAGSWQTVYRDYRMGKFRLADLRNSITHIGLTACVRGEGFRADGSYDYGASLSADVHSRLDDAFSRIENRRWRFETGDMVSVGGLVEMQRFLEYCNRENIHVVGFLPPYAHAIYAKMMATGNYRYLEELGSRLRPMFEAYKFTFADYTDLAILGIDDIAVIDGFHGDERAYRAIIQKLAKADSQLSLYVQKIQ